MRFGGGVKLSIGLVFGEQAINEWENKSRKLKAIFPLLKNNSSPHSASLTVEGKNWLDSSATHENDCGRYSDKQFYKLVVTPTGLLRHAELDSASIHLVRPTLIDSVSQHGMTKRLSILSKGVLKTYTSKLVAMTTSEKGGCKTLHFQACSFNYKPEREV